MPDLDVSEVITDPMFCEQLTIHRQTQTVGSDGISVTGAPVILTPYGVVTQGTIQDIERSPEGQVLHDNITIHCPIRLIDPSTGYQPDIVVWEGDQYVVAKSYNWSHFGAGFFAAECEFLPTVSSNV